MDDFPDYISISKAVNRIAERVCTPVELRECKNKIAQQIKYRVRRGAMLTNKDGSILFTALATFAKEKYPGKFDDWPFAPGLGCLSMTQTSGFAAQGIVLPIDIAECQQQILTFHAKTLQLEKQVQELKFEIDRLKPLADQYQANCATNKRSAEKRRNL